MARASLGSLVVSLGLDAGEFVSGLNKSEYQAQKSLESINKQFEGIGRSIKQASALLGGGFGIHLLVDWAKDVTLAAAALQDLSTETGSTVESLSRLQNLAKLSGTSTEDFQTAIDHLAVGLAGTADDSDKVTRAMKILGVSTKDPAQAMQEIATKLNQFADGVGKAAFARDVFGKSGVTFLAALKEIGDASELGGTRTAEQAQKATELAEAFRRLNIESTQLKDKFLQDVVPSITALITQFNEGIKVAGGFWEALNRFSTLPTTSNLEATQKAIEGINRAIADTKAKDASPFSRLFGGADALRNFEQQKQFLQAIQRSQAMEFARGLGDTSDQVDRANRKPALPYQSPGGAGKGRAERQSDAERYLETLQKQQEHLEELTVTEQLLRDIQMDRIKNVTHADIDRLLLVAQAIDATKAQKKAEEELKKATEERARADEQTLQHLGEQTASIQTANDALAEEVMLMGADEKTRIEFVQAQLADTIARKENVLVMLQQAGATADQTHEVERQIELLKDRQGILAQKGLKQALLDDAAAAKKYNDIFVSSFTDGLASIVDGTKSVSQAFKDMEKSIVQAITRIAAQKIAESIFGVGTSGGGGIGGWLASLFGGGGLSSSGGGFGEHFAGGGISSGGWAMVGERGPEAVRLPRGAQVIPNDVLAGKRAMRQTNIFNVTGGVTSKTADQLAVQIGRATRRAIERNA